MLKRIISSSMAVILLAVAMTAVSPALVYAAVDYNSIINAESNFIASCVLQSSNPLKTANAIVMSTSKRYTFQGTPHYKISPYFGNFAATALLDNPTAANITIVKEWMEWYLTHLNRDIPGAVNGSVFDYYVDNLMGDTEHRSIDKYASETDIVNYDSTDSYGATFLTLARKYVEVTGDKAYLQTADNTYRIELIGNSITATMQSDGLTLSKPDWAIKYLMDNTEVNEGLRDMVWLKNNVYNDASAANYYQNLVNQNANGIQANLWDSARNNYDSSWLTDSNWGVFYPDATCQLFPMWTGLIAPTDPRAISLYNTFNSSYGEWSSGVVKDPGGFPWTIQCYTAAVMGDKTRVDQYLTYLKSCIDAGTHPTNWYITEAAFVILAAKKTSSSGGGSNLAYRKPTDASYKVVDPALAVDGNNSTRWSSAVRDGEWWKVDLGSINSVGRVVINWEAAYATQYTVQVSTDNVNFTNVYTTNAGNGGVDTITFTPRNARYVKLICTKRVNTAWGSSFWEFEVYNN